MYPNIGIDGRNGNRTALSVCHRVFKTWQSLDMAELNIPADGDIRTHKVFKSDRDGQ